MDSEIKPEQQDFCIICSELLSNSNTVFVTEEILMLLRFLRVNQVTTTFQNSLMCEGCLEKINAACKFKISIEDSDGTSAMLDIKEDIIGEHPFVMCCSCKSTVLKTTAIRLYDLPYIQHIIKSEDLAKLANPLICESCQMTMSNLESLLDSLLCCENQINNETETIDYNIDSLDLAKNDLLNNDDDLNVDVIDELITEEMKGESKEAAGESTEDDSNNQDFYVKREELDLKMDCEEGPSGVGILNRSSPDRIFCCTMCDYETEEEEHHRKHLTMHYGTKHKRKINAKIIYDSKILKCHKCVYHTKRMDLLKKHLLIHKNENGMYPCELCLYQTKYKNCLERHMIIHDDLLRKNQDGKYEINKHVIFTSKITKYNQIFDCPLCTYQSRRKQNLKQHMSIHSTNVLKCGMCKYTTKYKNCLKRHMSIHDDPLKKKEHSEDDTEQKMFPCEKCTYQSRRKSTLKQHMLVHKKDNETEMFKCEFCNYKTKYKTSLKRHTIVHCESKDETNQKEMFEIKIENETEVFKCHKCVYRTTRKECLEQHLLIHKVFNNTEEFKCDMCNFQTKHKHYLKRHMTTHSPNFIRVEKVNQFKGYACEMCTYRTINRQNLNRHYSVHKPLFSANDPQMRFESDTETAQETKSFSCKKCPYKTNRRENLKLHVVIHKDVTETEMFGCEVCKYQSKRKSCLKRHILVRRHMLTHYYNEMLKNKVSGYTKTDNPKKYKCEICIYDTNRKENLKKHVLLHNDTVETVMYICEVCKYQTRRKNILKRHILDQNHMLSNTLIKIEKQEVPQKSEKILIKTEIIDGIKIFKCSRCAKKAKSKAHLRQHILIHKNINDVDTFNCKLCEYKTKYRNNFKRHMNLHNDKRKKYHFSLARSPNIKQNMN